MICHIVGMLRFCGSFFVTDLYVGIGSNKTIKELKDRKTVNPRQERLYMVKALKAVKDTCINSRSGLLDFIDDLKSFVLIFSLSTLMDIQLKKRNLLKKNRHENILLVSVFYERFINSYTTSLREVCTIPYRWDLAGGLVILTLLCE